MRANVLSVSWVGLVIDHNKTVTDTIVKSDDSGSKAAVLLCGPHETKTPKLAFSQVYMR